MLENWINSGIKFITDIIDEQGKTSEIVTLSISYLNKIGCQKNP